MSTETGLSRSIAWALTIVTAVIAGALTGWASAAGWLSGWLALGLLGVAIITIPSVRTLSGRIFVNSVLTCAITYLSWMLPDPALGTHGDRLLAFLAAVAVGCGVARLIGLSLIPWRPVVSWLDLSVLVMVPVAALNSLQLWLNSRTLDLAYGTLSAFWDNSSHYYLVSAMHEWQTITRYLPTPADGSANGFIDYPVGYHSSAASLMDLMMGSPAANPAPHPVAFLFVTAALATLGYLIVAAGVASLPAIRGAGIWGGLSVGGALSVMAFGPGFLPQADAQYNFFYAITMVVAAAVAATMARRIFDPIWATTLLAAILCAGGAWLPLGLLAALLACAIFVPASRESWRANWPTRIWVVGCGVVVLIFTIIPVTWLAGSFTGEVFARATGGVSPVNALLVQFGVSAMIIIVIVLIARRALFRTATEVLKLAFAGAVLVVAIFCYVAVEAAVMASEGQPLPPYYPQKVLNSLVTVLWVILAIIITPLLSRLGGRLSPSKALPKAIVTVLMAALGLATFWTSQLPVLGRGGLAGTYVETLKEPQPRKDLKKACAVAQGLPKDKVVLIVTGRAADTLVCAGDRLAYTSKLWSVNADAMMKWDADLVAAVRPGLQDGSVILVVDPFVLELFRRLVGPQYAAQVIPW